MKTPQRGEPQIGETPDRATNDLPLMDPNVLIQLEQEVGSPEIARRFAQDYSQMWDGRQRRLSAAFHDLDRESALDAVISVKISSAMVGGLRLGHLAEKLEHIIRHGKFQDGHELLGLVATHGTMTVQALQATYLA